MTPWSWKQWINTHSVWKVETPKILTVPHSNLTNGQKSQRNATWSHSLPLRLYSSACILLQNLLFLVHYWNVVQGMFFVWRREPRYLCTSWGPLPEQAFSLGPVVINLTGLFTLWARCHRKTTPASKTTQDNKQADYWYTVHDWLIFEKLSSFVSVNLVFQ